MADVILSDLATCDTLAQHHANSERMKVFNFICFIVFRKKEEDLVLRTGTKYRSYDLQFLRGKSISMTRIFDHFKKELKRRDCSSTLHLFTYVTELHHLLLKHTL